MTDTEKAIALLDFTLATGQSSDSLRADARACKVLIDTAPTLTQADVDMGYRITDFVIATGNSSDQLRQWGREISVAIAAAFAAQ